MKTIKKIEKIELPVIRKENGLTITQGTSIEMKLNEVIDRVNELSSPEKKEEPIQEFTKEELEYFKGLAEDDLERCSNLIEGLSYRTIDSGEIDDIQKIINKIERLLK